MNAVRKSLSRRNTQNNALLEFRGFSVFCGGKLAVPFIVAFVAFAVFVLNRQVVLAQVHPDRATLRRDLDAVTTAPILSRSHWSILIKSLDKGDIIYEQNARKLVMPASNMKVFTIAGAAAKLGWDYRYQTSLESDAPVVNGILMGDLVVRGSGDPSIGTRDGLDAKAFDDWASQLRAASISSIDGRIVGNDDLFDDTELGTGWSWDDLAYGYAAPVSALTYNESLVTISARPGQAVGSPVLIDVTPQHHGFTVVSHATTSEANQPETLDVSRAPGSLLLDVTGTVPLASQRLATVSAAVENPTLFFARSLRAALIARGIPVSGEAVDADLLSPADSARALPSRRTLAIHRSQSLAELARTFLKVSQNLYGELLVKTVGASAGHGTAAGGQQLIRDTLNTWGVPADSYILADGSGLSRLNFVSAEALVAILEHMYKDPQQRQALLNALPVGGQDGTLRNRLKATWTAGQVHAKTGSIANTRALSGFLTTRAGETFVFSIVANNFSLPAWRIERVIDLIVEIIAR
jgi:D-alanyl-D-alanine carboxypeptidase/D-alanyl-D-alanine-endopeptidase (penicillin-binding protein 4)